MSKPLTGPEQDALLEELLAARREDARSFARQATALVRLNNLAAREEAELSLMAQFPVVELAGSLRLSQQAAASQSAEAQRLVCCLPRTHAALAGGELLVGQAKVLLEVTKNAAPLVAARVEAALLPEMLGWCTPDLRRRAAAMVVQVESELDLERGTDLVGDRLVRARSGRRVTLRPEPDGMAGLWGILPAELAVRFRRDLDELARLAKLSDAVVGVVRTADQRRADVLCELPGLVLRGGATCSSAGTCSGGTGSGPVGGGVAGNGAAAGGAAAARVTASGLSPVGVLLEILVPMDTVLDRGVQPAMLSGYGPISAAHVRLLRPAAHLRAVYADSRTGQPIAVGDRVFSPGQAKQASQAKQAKQAKKRQRGRGKRHGSGGAEQFRSAPATSPAPLSPPASAPSSPSLPPGHASSPPPPPRPFTGPAASSPLRLVTWDEAEFRARVQEFVRPVEVTDGVEPQHDPSRRLTRLTQVRDVRCAGPGCSVPARRCDRDHLIPYGQPGGVTAAWNVLHLSRRCHRAKHAGWRPTVHPDGSVSWVSPLGREYRRPAPHDRPEPTDWTRWEGSARWGPTGLSLLPPRTASPAVSANASPAVSANASPAVSATARGQGDADQDWDWGRRLAGLSDTAGRGHDESHADAATGAADDDDEPPPF